MKTTVYSWRVTLERKAALEELARKRKQSVAEIIDQAVNRWLEHEAHNDGDAAAQRELHRSAAPAIGRISGGDPSRAEQARDRIRQKLKQRHKDSR